MPESAIAAHSFVEALDGFPVDTCILLYNHLAYSLSVVYHERLIAEVDQYHPYLSTVVGVDSTGSVDK